MSTLPLWACAVIGAGVFFGLMFLKLHVGLSMMIGGFVGFILTRGLPAAENTLATTIFEVSTSPILVIIPLFVLMGVIAGAGGVIGAAFETFDKWLGHLRGGLAMATVGTCAAFGAVCGDNIATAVTMNKAALPQMRKYGYQDKLSFGSIAAGGNLGILIPPSAAFVVYGFITENNIANLFVSGIVPGLILTVMFMVTVAIWVRVNPKLSSRHEPVPMKARLASLKGLIGILVVFGLVMGGLMGGVFTPQEAGAMGTVAVIVVSLFYKQLTWKKLGHALVESTRTSAMILLLIMGARYFSYFITTTELAQTLSDLIVNAEPQRLPRDPRGVRPVDHPRHAHGHLVGDDHHAAALLRHPHRQHGVRPAAAGRHRGAVHHARLHHAAGRRGGVLPGRHAQGRADVHHLQGRHAVHLRDGHLPAADHLRTVDSHVAAEPDDGGPL